MYKLEAELWAVRDGLWLCILLQIQYVEIENDSKYVVSLLTNNDSSNVEPNLPMDNQPLY